MHSKRVKNTAQLLFPLQHNRPLTFHAYRQANTCAARETFTIWLFKMYWRKATWWLLLHSLIPYEIFECLGTNNSIGSVMTTLYLPVSCVQTRREQQGSSAGFAIQAGSFNLSPRLKKGIEHLGLQTTLPSNPHSHVSLHPRSNFWPCTQLLPLIIVKLEELLETVVDEGTSVEVEDVDVKFERNGGGTVELNIDVFILSSSICVGRTEISSMSSKDKSWREPFSADFAAWLPGGWCSCTSKFIARPLLEFLAVPSSVCGLRIFWPPPSLGSEELAIDDFVLVEWLLLEDSVVGGFGVVDSVVVDGVVDVVVFPTESVHKKKKPWILWISWSYTSVYQPLFGISLQALCTWNLHFNKPLREWKKNRRPNQGKVNLGQHRRNIYYMNIGLQKHGFRFTSSWWWMKFLLFPRRHCRRQISGTLISSTTFDWVCL